LFRIKTDNTADDDAQKKNTGENGALEMNGIERERNHPPTRSPKRLEGGKVS